MRPQLSRLDRLARRLAGRAPTVATDADLIEAAVALVFAPDPESLLLIRRARRDGDPWSGQMGLPGGRRGGDDPDLLATAIRETGEEVGLDLSAASLLGPFDDLVPGTPLLPRIMVRPFVFRLDRPRALRPNHEVDAADWITLDELFAPGVFGTYEVTGRGLRLTRPGYRVSHGIVWGMTERILTPLLRLSDPSDIDN